MTTFYYAFSLKMAVWLKWHFHYRCALRLK